MITVDGQVYEKQEDVPFLGSLVCVESRGSRRFYRGLDADSVLLPKYDNLGTGSIFRATDTSLYMVYDASTKTWYKQSSPSPTPDFNDDTIVNDNTDVSGSGYINFDTEWNSNTNVTPDSNVNNSNDIDYGKDW